MTQNKVWLSNDNGVKIVTLTDERLPEVLKLFREAYYTDEPVSLAVRLQVRNNMFPPFSGITTSRYPITLNLDLLNIPKFINVKKWYGPQ